MTDRAAVPLAAETARRLRALAERTDPRDPEAWPCGSERARHAA